MSRRRSLWVPHPSEVYVVAETDADAFDAPGEVVQVTTSDNQTLRVKKDQCVEIRDKDGLSEQCDDLILLREVNEATILHTLRGRFKQDKIYTAIGTVLVSLNPFRSIEGLYDEAARARYSKAMYAHRHDTLPPHVFVIAGSAFNNMRINHTPQSILISGESGAGKTEATKQCLQFLSTSTGMDMAAGHAEGGEMTIEEKVIAASPILEAFGNAKTVRNDNSSRFGKWMNILFRKSAPGMVQMVACQTASYLLEKSRVTTQDTAERNFHIFYQLLTSTDDELQRHGTLRQPEQYAYLSQSGCVTLETQDDAANFVEVIESFATLGFSADTVQCIMAVTAAVLTLGNIAFDPIHDGEGSELSGGSEEELETICRLLEVPVAILQESLVAKTIQIGTGRRSLTTILLKPGEAAAGRDALARNLFQKLFEKIIVDINKHSLGDGLEVDDGMAIGILDIFGFEIFTTNSLEQLCINYANEALQKHFNNHIFTLETQLYAREGVYCEQIAFRDNTQVINLIQSAFLALDEEGRIPKGTSETFFSKYKRAHSDGKSKQLIEFPALRPTFKISHYAGSVEYEPVLFMTKNKDTYSANLVATLQASKNGYISELFAEPPQSGGSPNSRSASKAKETVTSLFRGQMQALVTNLEETKSHFIRCVKSNGFKRPREMDALLVYEQLRCSGVLEIVQIQQSGLPFRYRHEDFVKRCRPVVRWRFREHSYDMTELGSEVDDVVSDLIRFYPDLEFQVGKTMVFYTANENRILETALQHTQRLASLSMQRFIRGFICRILRRTLAAVRRRASDAVRERNVEEMESALAQLHGLQDRFQRISGSLILQQDIAGGEAALQRFVLQDACAKRLEEILVRDLFEHVVELEEVLAEATALEFDVPLVQNGRKELATVQEVLGAMKLLEGNMSQVSIDQLDHASTTIAASADRIRSAFPNQNVDKLLTTAQTRLEKLRIEVDKYFPKMAATLAIGAVSLNDSGEVIANSAETTHLAQVLSEFGNVIFESEDCTVARQVIGSIVQLRQAVTVKNVADAEQALRACQEINLPVVQAIVQEELNAMQAYIVSEQSVQTLARTFSETVLPPQLPLRYPNSQVVAFKTAINDVKRQPVDLLPFATSQLRCMELVYELRRNLVGGDLKAVADALEALRRLSDLRPTVDEECSVAEQHLIFFRIRDGLDEIVQAGPRLLERFDYLADDGNCDDLQTSLDGMTSNIDVLQRQASHFAAVAPLVARVQLLLSLRHSLLKRDLSEVEKKLEILRSTHANWLEVAGELQLSQRIFELLRLKNELTHGLSDGQIRWVVHDTEIDVDGVTDTALRSALDRVSAVDHPPPLLVRLINTCKSIRQARLLVVGRYTFSQLDAAMQPLKNIEPLPLACVNEVDILHELCARAFASESMAKLLQVSVARGNVGNFAVEARTDSDLVSMLTASQQAVAQTRTTPTLERLLKHCEYMTEIRRSVVAGDWPQVRQLLREQVTDVDDGVAVAELALVRAEIQHEDTIAALLAGCYPLNFTSLVGEMQPQEIETERLEVALSLAATHGTYNGRSTSLKIVCQMLLQLRQCASSGAFDSFDEHTLGELEHKMTTQQLNTSEVCRYQHERQNSVAVQKLKSTLLALSDTSQSSQALDDQMSGALEWCDTLELCSEACSTLAQITRHYLRALRSTAQQRHADTVKHVDVLWHEMEHLRKRSAPDDLEVARTVEVAAAEQRRVAEGHLLATELQDLLAKSQIRGRPFHLLFDRDCIASLEAFLRSERQGKVLQQYSKYHGLLAAAAVSLKIRQQIVSNRQRWFASITEDELAEASKIPANEAESRVLSADFMLQQSCHEIEAFLAAGIFVEPTGTTPPTVRQEVLTGLGQAVNALLRVADTLPTQVNALAAVGNELISVAYEWAPDLAHHSLPVVTELNTSLTKRVAEIERQRIHLTPTAQQHIDQITSICISHYADALTFAHVADLLQEALVPLMEPVINNRQATAATVSQTITAQLSEIWSKKSSVGAEKDDTAALLEIAHKLAEAARFVSFGLLVEAASSTASISGLLERLPNRASGAVQHLQRCLAQLLGTDKTQSQRTDPEGSNNPQPVVSRAHYRDVSQLLPTVEELTTVTSASAMIRRSLLVSFADHPDLQSVVTSQRRAEVICDLLTAVSTLSAAVSSKVPLTDILASPNEFLYVDYWRVHCVVRRVPLDNPAFAVGADELAAVLTDIANRLLKLINPSRPFLGLKQSSEVLELLDVPFFDLVVDEPKLVQDAAARWVEMAAEVKSLIFQVALGAQILENFKSDEEDLQLANETLEVVAAELSEITHPADCARILQAAELLANLRNEASAPSSDEQFHNYLMDWSGLPQVLRTSSQQHIEELKIAHKKNCHKLHVENLFGKLQAVPLELDGIAQDLQKVHDEVLHTPSVAVYSDELHMWEALLSVTSLMDSRTAAFMESRVETLKNSYQDRIAPALFDTVLFACKKQQILQHSWDFVFAREAFPEELLSEAHKGRDNQVDYVLEVVPMLQLLWTSSGQCVVDEQEIAELCDQEHPGMHYLRDAIEYEYLLFRRNKLIQTVHKVEVELAGTFAQDLFSSPSNPTTQQQDMLQCFVDQIADCQHVPMGTTLQHWLKSITQTFSLVVGGGEPTQIQKLAQGFAALPGSDILRTFGAELAAFLEWRCVAPEIVELLTGGVEIVDSKVVAPPAKDMLRLLQIASYIKGHVKAGQFWDLAELLTAVHELRVTATCDAGLGDKLPAMISRAKAALRRATTEALQEYVPEEVAQGLKVELSTLADYIPSHMSTKELQQVLASKSADCAPLEAAIAFTEQFDNLDDHTQLLLRRARLVLKLRKAQANEAWLIDVDQPDLAHATVEQIVQDWFDFNFERGHGAAEFYEARNLCAEHRFEAYLDELEAIMEDDESLIGCLERILHFAINHRVELGADAYQEVDACMAVYGVLTAYSRQRWGMFWQHSRTLRIFSTGLPFRLQFLTPVLERVQKEFHEALLCDYLLSLLLNVERPIAQKWFADNKVLLSTLENCVAWVQLEPLIQLLMGGSMPEVVAEWTKCSSQLKAVLDSADEGDPLVAALVARLCLLKRTYMSEVAVGVNVKIFAEAATIEDALKQYPLVHSMLESVKEYQLDKVDLELRNIDDCWNLLFHFNDCTGNVEKTARLATIPNDIQAQRVRHLLYEKFQSQTALDMTLEINAELQGLGRIIRIQTSTIDCMQEMAWHYATLDGFLKRSKAIMLQSGSSIFEDLQQARSRAKLVQSLRRAVLQQNWVQVDNFVAEIRHSPHGRFLAEEVNAAEALHLHHQHLADLQQQLAEGRCDGELGEMDDAVDDINLDGLQQVLSGYAPSKAFAISNEVEQLRASAMFILRLREAVVEGTWGDNTPMPSEAGSEVEESEQDEENEEEAETVSDLLRLRIATQPIPAASAEIQRVRDELFNKSAAILLAEALGKGASYVEDINDFRLVDCDTLQYAISRAVALNVKSVRVQSLLPAAQKVRQLRVVVTSGEWLKLRSLLEELKDEDLIPEIAIEIRALQEIDHINFALQEKILSAIQKGCVQGVPTQLNTKAVSITDLNAALAFAAQRNIHSKADQSLIRTAELLRDLRLCLLSADFGKASQRLKGSTVASLHPAAKEELLLIEAAVETIDVLEELTQALLLDAPTGAPGSLSTATVRIRRIENVLASTATSELESMSQLAPSVRAIRDLRTAICNGKWDERVVAQNPVLRKATTSDFRSIQLTTVDPQIDDAAAESISEQLYKKLASSTLSSKFHSAVAPRPVHATEVPIAAPHSTNTFNSDSHDVYSSTIAITRALQMLGLSQDSVAFALSRLPARMSRYTEHEVRLIRNELYHRIVCHALQAAIAPLCTVHESVDTTEHSKKDEYEVENDEEVLGLLQDLEGAMWIAHHLGLPSPQSRRLYNTAYAMHSLRSGELSTEWDATNAIANLVSAGKSQQFFEEYIHQEVQLACARHQFRVITAELERQLNVKDVVFETRSDMQKLRQAWQRGMPGANVDEESLVMLDVTNTLHHLHLANKSRNFDAVRKACDELTDVLDRLPSKFQQFRPQLELEVSHQRRTLLEQKLPFLNFGSWMHSEVTGLANLQGVLSRLIESALAPFFQHLASKNPAGVAFETAMVQINLKRHALLRQFLDQSNKVLASVSAEGRNHPELRRQFLQTAYSAVFILATSLLCVRELLRPEPGEGSMPRLRSRSGSHSTTRGSISAAAVRNSTFMLSLQATVNCIPQVICSAAADAFRSLAQETNHKDSFSSSTTMGQYVHQVANFSMMAEFVPQLRELLRVIDEDSSFTVTQQTTSLLPLKRAV